VTPNWRAGTRDVGGVARPRGGYAIDHDDEPDRITESRAAHGLAAVAPAPALHTGGDAMPTTCSSCAAASSPGYSWTGGETLAWGTGSLRTARATVQVRLASPDHRAILLSSRFRWVGIARSCGNFRGHAGACVWTTGWVVRS
jgi:hypothetical protein